MRYRFLVLVTVLLLAPVASGKGKSRQQGPLKVDLALDLTLTVGGGALALMPSLIGDSLSGPWCGLLCDGQAVNDLDRQVIGNHSAGAAQASDVLVGVGLAAPFALGVLDQLVSDRPDGWSGVGVDSLIALETIALNNMLASLTKLAVRRPRPYVYDESVPVDERLGHDAAWSFYSAHTANAFCMATLASYLFDLRHPDSSWRWPVWIGSHLTAAGVGVLRVEAGRHFWTDVLTGAIVGSAVGFLVPYLHRTGTQSPPAEQAQVGWRISLRPLWTVDQAGLLVTLY